MLFSSPPPSDNILILPFILLLTNLMFCCSAIPHPPPFLRLHLFVCISLYKCTYVCVFLWVFLCGGAWIHVATFQQGKLTTTARMWRNSPLRTLGSCLWQRLSKATTREQTTGEKYQQEKQRVHKWRGEKKVTRDAEPPRQRLEEDCASVHFLRIYSLFLCLAPYSIKKLSLKITWFLI